MDGVGKMGGGGQGTGQGGDSKSLFRSQGVGRTGAGVGGKGGGRVVKQCRRLNAGEQQQMVDDKKQLKLPHSSCLLRQR